MKNNLINRCHYLNARHEFELREESIPEPRPDEVLVKIIASGICGSDIHFYKEGKLGPFVVNEPYVPGHEASGQIVGMGSEVSGFSLGDPVVIEPGIPCGRCSYCRQGRYNLCQIGPFISTPPINGTFCEYITIRADSVHRMPDGMDFASAAMVEPAAVAVHAIKRARFAPGDEALVIGAGPIGLLVLQAFRAAGGGVAWCSDLQKNRLAIAEEVGGKIWSNDDQRTVDVVFDTSGSAKVCSSLFKYVKAGGCVVQVGWPAGDLVTLNVAELIGKELDYVGVTRYANTFPTAMEWIHDGRIQVAPLMTRRFNFEETAEAFRYTAENPADVIKTIVMIK